MYFGRRGEGKKYRTRERNPTTLFDSAIHVERRRRKVVRSTGPALRAGRAAVATCTSRFHPVKIVEEGREKNAAHDGVYRADV